MPRIGRYTHGQTRFVTTPSAFERRRPTLAPLIAEIRRGDRSKLKARPDMFGQSKDRYSVLTGVQVARYAGHIVSVDGRPAIVAGMTIVPNIDMSILNGTPNLCSALPSSTKSSSPRLGTRCCFRFDLAVPT